MILYLFAEIKVITAIIFFKGRMGSADCWLSRAIGSQNAVVLMLRKLLLL